MNLKAREPRTSLLPRIASALLDVLERKLDEAYRLAAVYRQDPDMAAHYAALALSAERAFLDACRQARQQQSKEVQP